MDMEEFWNRKCHKHVKGQLQSRDVGLVQPTRRIKFKVVAAASASIKTSQSERYRLVRQKRRLWTQAWFSFSGTEEGGTLTQDGGNQLDRLIAKILCLFHRNKVAFSWYYHSLRDWPTDWTDSCRNSRNSHHQLGSGSDHTVQLANCRERFNFSDRCYPSSSLTNIT